MSLHRPVVSVVSYGTVAPLINRAVMEDAAWREIVGLKPPKNRRLKAGAEPKPIPLKYEERLALSVIAGWTYTHDGQVTTGGLITALKKFLEKEKDAVMRILRDLEEAGFIAQVQSQDLGTVYHWHLRDFSVRQKLDNLAKLLSRIDQVIAAQIVDPENPEAGKDLVPEGVYYNIVTRRNERRSEATKS